MIAQKGWFARRKYSGWGATPVTWQGWLYTAVLVAPLPLFALFGASAETQFVGSIIWAAFLVVAMVDIMRSIQKDERETLHEAFAERNAMWTMVAVLAIGVAYQAASGIVRQAIEIDPVIIVALVAGLVVKAATNIYLDRKD